MLSYLLQKDVAEAKHWVAWVRRREWGEEHYQERERVQQEELEQREEEGDALRGRSEVITWVHNEQVEVAQHHAVVLLEKYFPLPPQVIATIWVSLPRIQISPVYLHELSTLHTRWGQQQGQPCIVHTGHVLSNHRTLADYTLPVHVLDDGSLLVYSAKSRFIPELCTLHRISALGNILSHIRTQVSSVSWVSRQGTFCIVALAPFTVGWWSDASNFILFLYVQVYYSIKILYRSGLVIMIFVSPFFLFFFLGDHTFHTMSYLIGTAMPAGVGSG